MARRDAKDINDDATLFMMQHLPAFEARVHELRTASPDAALDVLVCDLRTARGSEGDPDASAVAADAEMFSSAKRRSVVDHVVDRGFPKKYAREHVHHVIDSLEFPEENACDVLIMACVGDVLAYVDKPDFEHHFQRDDRA